MNRFDNKLLKELSPRSKQICVAYCELPLINGIYKLSNNIPIFVKYIIACFFQQNDHFVDAENAENWYKLSNSHQTVTRRFESDIDDAPTIRYIWRRILCNNLIDCHSELCNLKHLNELLFTWIIKVIKFPGITISTWYTGSIMFGLINLPQPSSTTDAETIYYAMDDHGNANLAIPSSATARYHNLADWHHDLKSDDSIKIEFRLNCNKGNIRFYKNNTLFLEYDAIDSQGAYRMYISTNAYYSECSLINYKCQIS